MIPVEAISLRTKGEESLMPTSFDMVISLVLFAKAHSPTGMGVTNAAAQI